MSNAIKVCTYNIAGGINEDNRFYNNRGTPQTARRVAVARNNLDQIAQRLADENVDIVALQEVDVCWNGDDTLREADYLADALSMNVCYQPSFDYNLLGRARVTTGVATLSRQPIVDSAEIRFPQRHVGLKNRFKNRLLGAKKALRTRHVAGDVDLTIINAHLTHGSPRQRDLELQLLLDACADADRVVLAGDLNTTPLPTRADDMLEPHSFRTDRCMELLAQFRAHHGERFQYDARLGEFGADEPAGFAQVLSYPSDAPAIKLDYLFGYSRDGSLVMAPEAVLNLTVSNHAPVVATVRIQHPGE